MYIYIYVYLHITYTYPSTLGSVHIYQHHINIKLQYISITSMDITWTSHGHHISININYLHIYTYSYILHDIFIGSYQNFPSSQRVPSASAPQAPPPGQPMLQACGSWLRRTGANTVINSVGLYTKWNSTIYHYDPHEVSTYKYIHISCIFIYHIHTSYML